MKRFVMVLVLLAISAPALAEKVEICHLSDEGEVNTISISESAIDAHMAHGDFDVDEDGDCVFELCLVEHYYEGLGFPEQYNKYTVLYFPASGEIKEADPTANYIVAGLISPVGYSIFRAGSYYNYTYTYPDPKSDFVGSGMTFDDSGMFVGIWKRPDDRDDSTSAYQEGEADTDYTFTPGACSD